MSGEPVVHIGENSPEQVAYRLMSVIASKDGYTLGGMGDRPPAEWVIKTYCACLHAIRHPKFPNDAISLLPKNS